MNELIWALCIHGSPSPCKMKVKGEEKVKTYWNNTIATLSFNILSPNMTAYNFGSTLRVWKIDKTVTGSVDDKRAPKIIESKRDIAIPFRPVNATRYTRNLHNRLDF